jgi:hypothetical protein
MTTPQDRVTGINSTTGYEIENPKKAGSLRRLFQWYEPDTSKEEKWLISK